MKTKLLGLILTVAMCGTGSTFATPIDNESMDIRAITPIKSGMDSEQIKHAVDAFLKESLKPEGELKQSQITGKQFRQCGVRGFYTYTLEDASEWVMGLGGLNRFLGYVYLKKAIAHYNLQTLDVVETRYAFKNKDDGIYVSVNTEGCNRLKNIPLVDSHDFFSLSLYIGDVRPEELTPKEWEEIKILNTQIGFTDTAFNANLRRYQGKIYVIDTEYASFSNSFAPYFDIKDELSFRFEK